MDAILAAGVILTTSEGLALFLLRSKKGDYPISWALPGGKIEEGETAEEAALRETEEETGHKIGTRLVQIHNHLWNEKVDFTTFEAMVDEPFIPIIDGEHLGFAWAPLDNPPEPLHPGVSDIFADLMRKD